MKFFVKQPKFRIKINCKLKASPLTPILDHGAS